MRSAIACLAERGLRQYEISNFARPGQESRHNLRYWKRQPYLGFGLDAHSLLRTPAGSALRFETTAVLDEYVGATAAPIVARELSPVEELEEAWFLGLRLREGVQWSALQAEFQARSREGWRAGRPRHCRGVMRARAGLEPGRSRPLDAARCALFKRGLRSIPYIKLLAQLCHPPQPGHSYADPKPGKTGSPRRSVPFEDLYCGDDKVFDCRPVS